MPCVVPTINLFSIHEIGHPKWRVALGFRAGLFEGFFRTPCGSLRSRRQAPHPLASTNPASIDFSARRCERIRNPPCARKPSRLAIGIDAGEIDGPVWSVSGRGTAGPSVGLCRSYFSLHPQFTPPCSEQRKRQTPRGLCNTSSAEATELTRMLSVE